MATCVCGGSPAGPRKNLVATEFLELVSGIFTENYMSRIGENDQVVVNCDKVAEVAWHFGFPENVASFEV